MSQLQNKKKRITKEANDEVLYLPVDNSEGICLEKSKNYLKILAEIDRYVEIHNNNNTNPVNEETATNIDDSSKFFGKNVSDFV